jgi:hypothetical protein
MCGSFFRDIIITNSSSFKINHQPPTILQSQFSLNIYSKCNVKAFCVHFFGPYIPSAVKTLINSGVLESKLVETSEDSEITNTEVVEATNTSVVGGAEVDAVV